MGGFTVTLWQRYRAAFRDLSEWLAQVFLPWRWVITFHEACQELRS